MSQLHSIPSVSDRCAQDSSPVVKKPLMICRWIKKRWFVMGGFLFLAGCVIRSAWKFPFEEMAGVSAAADAMRSTSEHFVTVDGVHAVVAGNRDAEVLLIFVHGSPGDWSAFAKFLSDSDWQNQFLMVAPDRPGYGGTEPGQADGSFASQAARLFPLARKFGPGKKVVWVGHSFGASVLLKLAVDSPDVVDGLVLIGGAVCAKYEQKKWYHRLADSKIGRTVISEEMGVANNEAIAFAEEFLTLEKEIAAITAPSLFLHARDDSLADPGHVAFAEEKMKICPPQVVWYEDGDHFILWSKREEMMREIENFVTSIVQRQSLRAE